MKDEFLLKYGSGGVTDLHALALFFAIIMVLLIFGLQRRFAFIPLILTLLFMPLQQRIAFFSLDFTIVRIVILAGLIRLIINSEYKYFKRNVIDKILILYVISSVISYTLLFKTTGAFINRMGFMLDTFGIYLLFRCFMTDFEDIKRVIKVFVITSLGVTFLMLIEYFSGNNLLSIFGGVPEATVVRGDRLRCQAAFSHALNAGAFGASLMPLTLSLLASTSSKNFGKVGLISATLITILSASSAPLIGYLSAVFALFLWYFKKHLRIIKITGLLSIILLHLVMKAPVWSLVGRAKIIGSSTGHHRYKLIENFINRFDEWWLCGTKFTGHWGYGMWDVTNTYVHVGVNGGLVTLILFLLIIILSFKGIGQALATTENDKSKQWLIWTIGAALFSHVVMFTGMSYYDQIRFIWCIHIAIISTIKCTITDIYH